jgi:hypothetical protein
MNTPLKPLENPKISNQENPYKNDLLKRNAACGKNLQNYLTATDEPMTVCVNAPYGFGKTTFLDMWRQDLENQGFPVVHFSAWENDFAEDPLVCLICELDAALEKLNAGKGETQKIQKLIGKLSEKAAILKKNKWKILEEIVTQGVGIGLGVATKGAVNGETVKSIKDAAFSESFSAQKKDYEDRKGALQDFRETLSKLASNVISSGKQKCLIIIIDELDRCRPDFAIELLERIKHLFNIKHIKFVIGADRKQLNESAKVLYGNMPDVNGYFRRFFDIDFNLKEPTLLEFIDVQFERLKLSTPLGTANCYDTIKFLLNTLSNLFSLSLRDLEHCCAELKTVVLSASATITQLNMNTVCFLIVLKLKEPEKYKKFIDKNVSPDDIWEVFELNFVNIYLSPNYPRIDKDVQRQWLLDFKFSILFSQSQYINPFAYKKQEDNFMQKKKEDFLLLTRKNATSEDINLTLYYETQALYVDEKGRQKAGSFEDSVEVLKQASYFDIKDLFI